MDDPGTEPRLREISGTVYGVPVRGRLPAGFRPYLSTDAGAPAEPAGALELAYRVVEALPETEEIWSSEAPGASGTDRFTLFSLPDGFGLTVDAEGRGLFRCTPRTIEVDWVPPEAAAPHYLFSYALPLWLEARGVPVLHGSAVTFGDRAVAFVGPSGVGKSVLCAELLRYGCAFLSDDGVAVRQDPHRAWRGSGGPPLLRLWPSGLEGWLGIAPGAQPRMHEAGGKRRLALGAHRAAPPGAGAPLALIYVVQRRADTTGAVQTTGCSPREALVRLLENGVASAPVAALGRSEARLELLADLVEDVPVRLLRFPSGAGSGPRIRTAIAADLKRLELRS